MPIIDTNGYFNQLLIMMDNLFNYGYYQFDDFDLIVSFGNSLSKTLQSAQPKRYLYPMDTIQDASIHSRQTML